MESCISSAAFASAVLDSLAGMKTTRVLHADTRSNVISVDSGTLAYHVVGYSKNWSDGPVSPEPEYHGIK